MANVNTLPVTGSPYQVPPEPSPVSSTLMAVAVHAALIGFLWVGIRWQNVEPVAVTAEVWDMKVQDAAPNVPTPTPVRTPPPPPRVVAAPPPPPKVEQPAAPKPPDIALEREKKQKELREKKLAEKVAEEKLAKERLAQEKEREKDEAERKLKELAEKKAKAEKLAKAAEDKLIQKAREAQMKRILGGVAGAGDADRSTAPKVDDGYINAIRSKIKGLARYNGADETAGNPAVTFKIEQLPTGEILSIRKSNSSGIDAFDDAVERAIYKSSPLPKKKDGTVVRSLEVTFKMKEIN